MNDMLTTPQGKKRAIDQLLTGENPKINWELTHNVIKYRTTAIKAKTAAMAKEGAAEEMPRKTGRDPKDTLPLSIVHGHGGPVPAATRMQLRAQPNDPSLVETADINERGSASGGSWAANYVNTGAAWVYRCPLMVRGRQDGKGRVVNQQEPKRNLLTHIAQQHYR